MSQAVIDLHDVARLAAKTDMGVSASMRRVADDLSEIVLRLRQLLVLL